ncbi:hypothetical protein [Pseudomonas caspiana]|uniref:Uncharacterized protein n=1 Tax=Pseudomonas caspiana TaxID=1451454 RepID=A0A1Y3NZ06_9PSED|nr:hypothetical protein [Pseudomonas caspiana]OUM71461.1 hypothetical protein AUC60_22795 [Pseudomonas caspiana]
MAKKSEFLVVEGSVQDGHTVFARGEYYSPPSKEVEETLISEGCIAPLKDPRAQELLRQQSGVANEDDDSGGE